MNYNDGVEIEDNVAKKMLDEYEKNTKKRFLKYKEELLNSYELLLNMYYKSKIHIGLNSRNEIAHNCFNKLSALKLYFEGIIDLIKKPFAQPETSYDAKYFFNDIILETVNILKDLAKMDKSNEVYKIEQMLFDLLEIIAKY